MDNSDSQRPNVAEHKWIRILAAVKSLHEFVVKSCKAGPAVSFEETTESAECSSLQWMEYLLQCPQGLSYDNPPEAASSARNNSTSTITADVGVSTSSISSSHEEPQLSFHPLLVNQDLSSQAKKESTVPHHVASDITSNSSINVDLRSFWENWEQQVLLHFTPNPPPSYTIPSFHSLDETTHKFLQDYYLYNESNYCHRSKEQWRGFNLETIYEIHDYEQQISCLQRLTREFQIAWSRKEYALVHSILVREVAFLSNSITPKLTSTGTIQLDGAAFNNVTNTDYKLWRRWYPVTFVYVVRLLDDFRLKILQRIQSFSSQGGDDETVSRSITYPPSYLSNHNIYSLHGDGSEFRVDFIAASPDHDNRNCVTGSPTIIFHEWLSKTRAIYHLIPRIYLEVSLIQSYFFIISSIDTLKFIDHGASQHQDRTISIHQLSSMLRGIGDPIVMIYLLCYIII